MRRVKNKVRFKGAFIPTLRILYLYPTNLICALIVVLLLIYVNKG